MRNVMIVSALTAAMACFAGPAMAQAVTFPAVAEQGVAIASAHTAIVAHDFATAEYLLRAEQRIFPNRADVLINLAAVYAYTGRAAQAAGLYRQVLAGDDVVMNVTADRTATAHEIARIGLARIAPTETAAR